MCVYRSDVSEAIVQCKCAVQPPSELCITIAAQLIEKLALMHEVHVHVTCFLFIRAATASHTVYNYTL